MRATSIQIGKTYEVKTGRNATTVKIESFNQKTGSWTCETKGGKSISIKDATRFVREVGIKKAKRPEGKKVSGLDAAYRVLAESGRPMKAKEIIEIAMQNGYCNLQGATPNLTIYAAMLREITTKNENSRFVKTGKGLFAAR